MGQVRKRKNRKGQEMVDKCLHLPVKVIQAVDRYAEVRRISRNMAFEELLAYLTEGDAGISEGMFQLSCREAGFRKFT